MVERIDIAFMLFVYFGERAVSVQNFYVVAVDAVPNSVYSFENLHISEQNFVQSENCEQVVHL